MPARLLLQRAKLMYSASVCRGLERARGISPQEQEIMDEHPPSEPYFATQRPPGDPLRRSILTGVAPASAEWSPQWVGFGEDIAPPPARFVGFGDEDLREAPPLPGAEGIARPGPPLGFAFEPTAAPVVPQIPAIAVRRRAVVARPARSDKRVFLTVLGVLLLAYALFGRSAAYVGLRFGEESGIFVGDLVLLFGLGVLVVKGGYERVLSLPLAMPWLFFVLWNASQTFPYLPQYGLTSLRDGAEWGYSLYAIIIAAMLLARPGGFSVLAMYYRRFVWIFVLLLPAVIAVSSYHQVYAPTSALLGFIDVRFGDALVSLVGVMAFAAGGLVSVRAPWWWLLGLEFVALASHNRGGMIAFLIGVGVLLLLNFDDWRGTVRRCAGFGGALLLLLLLSFAIDLRINAFVNDRNISPQQLVLNLAGSFEDTGNEALDGPREWRIAWWNKIIDYTLDGRYFWTGKGYGINLADADGFQLTGGTGPPLRSPHNSHLTFLARSGVPGFALWVLLQLTWAWSIVRNLFFARRTRRSTTAALMTFFLVYWVAEMIEAATDVTLEAPFAAIWFWAVFGAGIAAVTMLRRDVNFFERAPFAAAAKPGNAPLRRVNWALPGAAGRIR
jgi:O-antigen ligase